MMLGCFNMGAPTNLNLRNLILNMDIFIDALSDVNKAAFFLIALPCETRDLQG